MAILICLLLFCSALFVLPFGVSFFEIPKVILAEILIEIILVSAILKNKLNFKLFLNPALFGIYLLFLLTIIDLFFLKTNTSFFGNSFRLQGIFLLWHLVIFALISSSINLPKKVYLFSLFCLGVLTLSGFLLGGDANGRAFGTLGEPNSLAGAAIFLWPFVRPRKLKIISLVLVSLIILISGSRAGVIALLIQLIFLSLIFIAKFKLSKAFAVSLVLFVVALTLPNAVGGGWYENRSEIWYTALVAGSTSPFIGHGFGNTEQAIHQASLILNNNIQYQTVDSSHNIFLDFWVQGGFLGILSICSLVIFTIRTLLKRRDEISMAILLGLLVVLSFNPVSVYLLVAFWWIIGKGLQKE